MTPKEIIAILMILKEYQIKGILTNQSGLMKRVDVTKPKIEKMANTII